MGMRRRVAPKRRPPEGDDDRAALSIEFEWNCRPETTPTSGMEALLIVWSDGHERATTIGQLVDRVELPPGDDVGERCRISVDRMERRAREDADERHGGVDDLVGLPPGDDVGERCRIGVDRMERRARENGHGGVVDRVELPPGDDVGIPQSNWQ